VSRNDVISGWFFFSLRQDLAGDRTPDLPHSVWTALPTQWLQLAEMKKSIFNMKLNFTRWRQQEINLTHHYTTYHS